MDATNIIKKPVITEKTLIEASHGEYTFEVASGSTKGQITSAVKELFGVDVKQMKTKIIKGRTRRNLKKRLKVGLSPIKKVVIRVGKEQKIDIFEAKQ